MLRLYPRTLGLFSIVRFKPPRRGNYSATFLTIQESGPPTKRAVRDNMMGAGGHEVHIVDGT